MKYKYLLFSILLFLISCDAATNDQQKNAFQYFDIKGYFQKEASRLAKINPTVTKTAVINGSSETKKIKIRDWKREIAAISNADINKASWKGAFSTSKSNNRIVYKSNDKKIPVKEVTLIYKNNKVSGFLVLIRNSNSLYTSVDTITYYPDSLYQIKKTQDIKLLSVKNYQITVKF